MQFPVMPEFALWRRLPRANTRTDGHSETAQFCG